MEFQGGFDPSHRTPGFDVYDDGYRVLPDWQRES